MENYFVIDNEQLSRVTLIESLILSGIKSDQIIKNDIEETFKKAIDGVLVGGFINLDSIDEKILIKLLDISTNSKVILLMDRTCSIIEKLNYPVLDYLLKPLNTEQVHRVISSHFKSLSIASRNAPRVHSIATNGYHRPSRLLLSESGRVRVLYKNQIRYLKAAGNYVEIHMNDGSKIFHRGILKSFEDKLIGHGFIRIHRSTIVRMDVISEIRSNEKGLLKLIVDCGTEFPVSKKKNDLIEIIESSI